MMTSMNRAAAGVVLFASTTALTCTLLVWAAMAAFVRWYEEPVLATR